jgi:broad specificity phosphatase PhoE
MNGLITEQPPVICLAGHGETAWTITGEHTGLTDMPLTHHGERNAMRLGDRLGQSGAVSELSHPRN